MSKFKITYTLEADNLNDAMNVAHLLLLKDEDADISEVKVAPMGKGETSDVVFIQEPSYERYNPNMWVTYNNPVSY